MKKIKFGIVSMAKIAVNHVNPAILKSKNCSIVAIASQGNYSKARDYAKKHKIAHVYQTYDELLQDTDVDAIYNPLPNHLHIDWTLRAVKNKKHVLCEKPMAMDSKDLARLLALLKKHPDIKVMEAFMYRFHPQWKLVLSLIQKGKIGQVSLVDCIFSYYNVDPKDIRNKKEFGGGGLYDIGCYGISVSRLVFADEPVTVRARLRYDTKFKTDYLASSVLEFKKGLASFSCSTQQHGHQNVRIFGSKGYIEVPVPFNPGPNKNTNIILHKNEGKEVIRIPACNQYTEQAEQFSDAILKDKPVPLSLDDSVKNMKVIDAIFQS